MHRGIPTLYAGTQFRSRLEARWAALFDLLGWPWEYEPIDLPGWIPDFRIGDSNLLVDASAADALAEHRSRLRRARRAYYAGPVAVLTDARWLPGSHPGSLVVGAALLSPHEWDRRARRRAQPWRPLALRGSGLGDRVCLSLDVARGACMICGCVTWPLSCAEVANLARRWRLAGNATQWKGVGAIVR